MFTSHTVDFIGYSLASTHVSTPTILRIERYSERKTARRSARVEMNSQERARGAFSRAKSPAGYSGIGKGKKMANTPSKTASTLKSRDALMLEFKEKFGHTYDPRGHHGHSLFGYHCYGCGIHISRITNKGLQEQLALDVGKTTNGAQG